MLRFSEEFWEVQCTFVFACFSRCRVARKGAFCPFSPYWQANKRQRVILFRKGCRSPPEFTHPLIATTCIAIQIIHVRLLAIPKTRQHTRIQFIVILVIILSQIVYSSIQHGGYDGLAQICLGLFDCVICRAPLCWGCEYCRAIAGPTITELPPKKRNQKPESLFCNP